MNLANMLKTAGIGLLCFIMIACGKDNSPDIAGTGNIRFEFEHRVGTQALEMNTRTYVNALGEDFTVSAFKYYVSNIRLKKADGSGVSIPESYLLIDAADASTRIQEIADVPAGDYTGIELIIGVDEARNFGGAQTGALDPAKGMFWSWNSGYIFLKLDGTSSKSGQTGNQIFFHVGGAKAPVNTIRTVTLTLPTVLRVRSDANPDVHFIADVASLFKGETNISFAEINGFHGGANAILVADNYAEGLLRVDHIHN